MAVSERIKSIRERKGMNQKELAERVGISQPMICQIERGTKNPSLQVAYSISKVLECKLEDFLK